MRYYEKCKYLAFAYYLKRGLLIMDSDIYDLTVIYLYATILVVALDSHYSAVVSECDREWNLMGSRTFLPSYALSIMT